MRTPILKRAYIGLRDPDGTARVLVEDSQGRRRPLQHVACHSPTGFEWGYGGSGPADLALSILLDALGEARTLPRAATAVTRARAWELHDAFTWEVIAHLPRGEWRLTLGEVLDAVRAIGSSHRGAGGAPLRGAETSDDSQQDRLPQNPRPEHNGR